MNYIYKTNKRGKYLHKLVSGLANCLYYLGYWIGASRKLTPPGETAGCTCTPVYGMGRPGPIAYAKEQCKVHKFAPHSFTEEFLKSYCSFSGLDCHFVIVPHNGVAYLSPPGMNRDEWEKYYEEHPRKLVLEIQGISFTEYLNGVDENEVKGSIIATFFDEDPLPNKYFDGNHDIVLLFNNEYGHRADIRLSHIKLKARGTGVFIDDLMIDISYEFTAKSVEFSKAVYTPPQREEPTLASTQV